MTDPGYLLILIHLIGACIWVGAIWCWRCDPARGAARPRCGGDPGL
ncbi:hypothetical protein ACFSHQ_00870 [Gemmobacter lanyuensis]